MNEFLSVESLRKTGLKEEGVNYYNELNKDDKALLLNIDIVFDKDTTVEEMKAVLLEAKNEVESEMILTIKGLLIDYI